MKHVAVVTCIVLSLIARYGPIDIAEYGISALQCDGMRRLSYMCFHASWIHLVTNCWALLSICFFMRVRWIHLAIAIAIAATIPECVLSDTPIVGCSGVIYALLGMQVASCRRPMYIIAINLFFVALPLLLSFLFSLGTSMAWALHLYCLITGLFIGLLITPIKSWWPSRKKDS